ncbi:MAG: hypothetical protein ACRDRX_04325 [Pseudonocardiaceae bacterium]
MASLTGAAQLSVLVGEGRPLTCEQRYGLAALLATISGSVRAISAGEGEPADVAACWEPVEQEFRELLAVC